MDIVERLKLVGIGSEINSVSNDRAIANEAADEIERLREALQLIVSHPAEKTGEYKVGFREVRLVAAKALQQKGE